MGKIPIFRDFFVPCVSVSISSLFASVFDMRLSVAALLSVSVTVNLCSKRGINGVIYFCIPCALWRVILWDATEPRRFLIFPPYISQILSSFLLKEANFPLSFFLSFFLPLSPSLSLSQWIFIFFLCSLMLTFAGESNEEKEGRILIESKHMALPLTFPVDSQLSLEWMEF